ncbi:nuclear protein MDM1-like [Ciona intestinalis]
MPVKFRGASEYTLTYKWSPSYRSAEFQATEQQLAIEAGLRSDEMGLLMEPTFTRKRRVMHREPEAQNCLQWGEEEQDLDAGEKRDFSEEVAGKTYVKKKTTVVPQGREKITNGVGNKTYVKKIKDSSPGRDEIKRSLVERVDAKLDATKRIKKVAKQDKQVSENNQINKNTIREFSKPLPRPEAQRSPTRKHSPKRKSIQEQSEPVSPTKSIKSPKSSPKKETKSKNIPLRYRSLNSRLMSAHQTEYQQMFRQPARFVPSSPLISALDVVHQSSAAIPPHVVNKSPKMRLTTEYSSKYQNRSPLSKSMTLPTSPASPSLKMKVKNLPSPVQHHRSPKKVISEYSTQFPDREFPLEPLTNIHQEANQNKQNRDANSFDPDHATQLHSPKNKFWEIMSATESNIDTVSNSTSYVKKVVESLKSKDVDSCSVESIKGSDDDDCDVIRDENSVSCSSRQSLKVELPVARKLAWGESDSQSNDVDAAAHDEEDSDVASTVTLTESNTNEGRLPTPQLKKLGGALRTHHDITTPSRGGALLSSPPRPRRMISSSSSPTLLSKASSVCSVTNKTVPADPKSKRSPSPGCRMVRTDQGLPRRLQASLRAPIKGALKSQEFQHCGKNSRPMTAVDRLSMVSNRSNATAAKLLERSMQRQDFWANK